MNVHFTARRFKAHKEVKDYAIASVTKLDRFYDGIVRGDIILSFERTVKSVKTAEINLHVFGTTLSAREKSDDFIKSVDLAVGKLERQLAKYKNKVRKKNKRTLRRFKEEIGPPILGEEE